MKRIASFLVFSCIVLLGSNALGQSTNQGAYISGHIGGNSRPDAQVNFIGLGVLNVPFDPGFVLGGALGYEFGNNVRVEGEIAYRSNDVEGSGSFVSWDFSALSLMANGYYDIDFGSPLKPYVGAGVGLALVNSEIEIFGFSFDDNDTVFAYQFMTGLGYDISPKATLTLGYRYFTIAEDAVFDDLGFEAEFESHEFLFGARFRF